MEILPLNELVLKRLKRYRLEKKFQKQLNLLRGNVYHPSLNVELLEPKKLSLYSFKIDRKFRGIFIFWEKGKKIEILNVTVHYH